MLLCHVSPTNADSPCFRPLFYTITHDLQRKMTEWTSPNGKEINMLDILAKTSLEFIGQGGLGYSFEKEAADPHTAHRYGQAIHAILLVTTHSPSVLNINRS